MAACFADLPAPVLEFKGTENYEVRGRQFTRYRLGIKNESDFPRELFSPAPKLPPCGRNNNSSRTWVDIFDDQNRRIYGFCALSVDSLGKIWFAKPRGENPPEQVHVTFNDRECSQTYTSNAVSTSPVHVRENINTVAQDSNKLAALRRGIEEMKTRPATDPTSWIYQANIHGDPGSDGPRQRAWNTCQHGSWHFLAWHRMYLYYFERILRDASGDPNLNLPYWNYSDTSDPNARRIPLPYRQPANSQTNPLYVANRDPMMNGEGTLPEDSVDLERAFRLTIFSSPAGDGNSFGGQRTGSGHSRSPHSLFEGTPHDVIHCDVGGGMCTFDQAARDPVFWLHHANIDRLWEAWLAEGGGRSNPIAGSGDPWLNQSFEFYDENGALVTLTGAEIVDTVRQLNYRYDDQDMTDTRRSRLLPIQSTKDRQMFRLAEPRQLMKKKLDHVLLKGKPVSITVKLPEASTKMTQGNLVLHLDNVNVQTYPTSGHYQVYVNLPENEKPNYKRVYYVGNMSFFGFRNSKNQGSFTFSLIDLEEKLRASNKWTNVIKVTFIKSGPQPPPGQDFPQRSEEQEGVVQIGEIRITRE